MGKCFSNGRLQDGLLGIPALASHYDGLVIATGADIPKPFPSIPKSNNVVVDALDFVAWFNGNPCRFAHLDSHVFGPLFRINDNQQNGRIRVCIVGAGNVALDCARVILAPRTRFQGTDMPASVLAAIHATQDRAVTMLVRRGPKHVAFTAKEIRELASLVPIFMDPKSHDWLMADRQDKDLDRRTKRILDILAEKAVRTETPVVTGGGLTIAFWCNLVGLEDNHAIVMGNEKLATEIPCNLVLFSIGSNPVNLDPKVLPFNDASFVRDGDLYGKIQTSLGIPVYASGWSLTGSKGVLASTLQSATLVSQHLMQDLVTAMPNEKRPELPLMSTDPRILTWPQWKRMADLEVSRGEKITDCSNSKQQ